MPNAFDLTIRAAKGNFFDRPKVIAAVDKARLKYLRTAGGKVRLTARRSIRNAPQKKLSEMTKEEKTFFAIAQWKAKKEGRSKPKRPRRSSPPGKPPFSQTGLLKQFIFFSFDPKTKSTVVGPAKLNSGSGAPERLEHGADDLEARPFMRPALEKNEAALAGLWKDLVK